MKEVSLKLIIKLLKKRQFTSLYLRRLFSKLYNINVGLYSYGCFCPVRIAPGTRIGRYCSIADTVRILNGNHGLDYLTLHPYLYNTSLGLVSKETISRSQCVVEDDVWIGHNAIILPNARRLGRGSVIAAGAVVTKDVPRYAIVAGNPAKIIRMRFENDLIDKIEACRWWEWDKSELSTKIIQEPTMLYQPATYFADKDIGNH